MQIDDDILKAAIKHIGLESENFAILNDNTTTTNALTINTHHTNLYNNNNNGFSGGDDDFILDFSILNPNTPPQSTSPSTSSVSSSHSKCLFNNSNNVVTPPPPASSQPNSSIMTDDDSDQFLLAIKELDENNSKLQHYQNDSNKQIITNHQNNKTSNQPFLKIVSIKNTTTLNNNNSNANSSSDLLSLLNYRARNETPTTTTTSSSQIKTITPVNNLNNTSSIVSNPIKVINLSQIQHKTLQNKIIQQQQPSVNHKLIQITNRTHPMPSFSTPINDTHSINYHNHHNNNQINNNIKITKVVSSKPLVNNNNNSNQNLIYINGFSNNNNNNNNSQNNVAIVNKQQPPTMRLVGGHKINQPVQYITKIAAPINTTTTTTNTNFLSTNTNNNIPRFYAKPTRIITTTNSNLTTQQSNDSSIRTSINNTNNQPTNNGISHINILNSNISHYLNQSKLNTPIITNNNNNNNNQINLSTSINNNNNNTNVTINPKYLNSNTSLPNLNQQNNLIENNTNNNSNSNLSNYQNFTNYYLEQDEDVVVEEEEELGHAETYANYMPAKLKIGQLHPDPIVETSSLASVEPPDVWYNLKMPEHVYSNGALSALQLEAIVYACQKHQEFLPNNHRCGFLIGDGAGVGKGRTIAGMIYENYLIGRKKALWLSVSNDLKFDSQRDLADIGASKIQVHSLNKLKYCKISSKQNSKIKKGVIFSTYSSLIGESQHKTTKKKYSSRLKQLIQWLGGKSFDGLIVFDECHKAKNLVPVGSAKPTKTGLAVLELQEKLPNARIVYASATGASEPKNMAYMVRLGLWGPGTPFIDFNDFIQSIEKRGVGAMEIVAIDMKLRGMYIARQLSFSGVTFKIEEIPLKKEYVKMYNDAVQLWVEMKEKFQEAIELIDTEGKLKKTVWGQFWSSHQRFFKYLCMACKVPHVVDLARQALKNKKCVVIGLQSTGEARTLEQLDEFGEINEFVSTARGVLQNLVEKHFPSNENMFPTNKSNIANNGQNDQIKQQQSNDKRTKTSKESKNSQKVNDILQRLSTYTNNNNNNASKTTDNDKKQTIKQHQQNKKKSGNNSSTNNKRYRSSSMSSLSSKSSSINSSNSSNELDSNNEDDNDDEIQTNSDNNFDNSDFSDSYFDEDEDEVEELEEEILDDQIPVGQDQFEKKSIKIHDFDDIFETTTTTTTNNNNNDSDDSDSLFSITKSVSVHTLMNKNNPNKKTRLTSNNNNNHQENNKTKLVRTKRKKNSKNKINFNNGYEIEDEEEEDDDDDTETPINNNNNNNNNCDNDIDYQNDNNNNNNNNKNDDQDEDNDFKLPTKRLKINVNNNNLDENNNDQSFLTVSKQPVPKPKPTQPYEIADYICGMKRDLLQTIQQLGKRLPANTLDELIDLLDGPDKVAEMTGRKGRVVCRNNSTTNNNNNFVYETRNETDVPVELMNVVQKERFMNGEKLIAIISEAASSGISLQANRRYSNQLRRVHITIELPWSADRAIQQFGRTHRSNQVSAPEYVFLISELAGEKRFASTVAKRLESLGALTHGDRRATESRDLSRFNIDNKYGRSALENVIKSICNLEKPMAKLPKKYSGNFMMDARQALHGVGMIVCTNKNNNGGVVTCYPDKDYNSINKFLNRLLGCPVELQNAIFTFFSDCLAAVILEAKRTGKWDMGILDLGTNNEVVFKKEAKFYVLSNADSVKRVEMHTVLVERGLHWEKALEIYKKATNQNNNDESCMIENENNLTGCGFYISNQVKNNHRIAILAIASVAATNATGSSIGVGTSDLKSNFLSIYRPNTGLQVRQETTESILKKYKKVSYSEAKHHWQEQYLKSATECTHIYRQAHCSNARNCEIGLRTRKFYILAGSVLTVWSKVESTLSSLTCSAQFRLQIIRVKTDDNQKIVGCVIPGMCLKQIDALLCSMSSKQYVQSNEQNDLTVGPSVTIPVNNNNNNNSLSTRSIFKLNNLSSITTINESINNKNSIKKKCDNNHSNPIVNYDYP